MSQELTCCICHKHMALLRDARVRTGIVVYCQPCNKTMRDTLLAAAASRRNQAEMPDFLKGFFGGKKNNE